jgi:hypothetical protein
MANIIVEAESIQNLVEFSSETNSIASGGSLISLPNNGGVSGTATISAQDAGLQPGIYNVTIVYFDEDDGEATLGLSIGNNFTEEFILDASGTSNVADSASRKTRVFNNVTITAGTDEIVISGLSSETQNGVERVRVDYLEFEPANQAPTANDDATSTNAGTGVDINVRSNDSDPDGDPLSLSLNQPSNGTVAENQDGTVRYTPNAGFFGPTDSFTYTVDDGKGGTDTATVTITFNNNPPDAQNDSASTRAEQTVDINVRSNDSDPDGDPLSLSLNQPSNGTVAENQDGTVRYTPNAGFFGPTDSFTYTVDDGKGGTDTATVTITFNNNAPDAQDDIATTSKEIAVDIDVRGNDSDSDGDTLSLSLNQPNSGTVAENQDGTVRYTPNAGFTGRDSFTYTVEDGKGGSDTATVTVDVFEEPNTPPEAEDDAASTEAGQAVTINVLANDSDPNNDPLQFVLGPQPANGSVSKNQDNTITYVPADGFSGSDKFTYTLGDGRGGSDTANVTVNVEAPKLTVSDSNYIGLEGTTGTKSAVFTLLDSKEAGLVEVGIFKVDANGSVNGISPGDSNYATAALQNAETIFSSLGDDDIKLSLSRLISLTGNHQYGFYVIQDGTTDSFLASGIGTPEFGGGFGSVPANSPLSYDFLEDEGAYVLNWNLDDDGLFDDFSFKVDLAEDGTTVPLGANLQGGSQLEVVDLRGLTGTYEVSVTVYREADYDNVLGFYQVDALTGAIGSLTPGQDGYAEAAVEQWLNGNNPSLQVEDGNILNTSFTVEAGKILVPFLVVDGAPEALLDDDATNDPEVYFPFIGANSDGVDHVRLLGDNTFGFEDLRNGGDKDFDDIIAQISVQAV